MGSFRSEACTDFTVTPGALVAPVGGGEVVVKVETAPGCLWDVSSQSGFLTLPSDTRHAGTRFVSINVEANQTGAQRTGTLGVAGTSIEVRQLATDAGICGRTPTIVRAIAGQRPCDEVTDQHLSEITVLSVARKGLTSVKAGDFAGLSGLERLNLGTNRLAELPEDLFAGLSSLKTLYLGYNQLTQLPEGLFADLSSIESLDLTGNRLTDLPEGLFAGLSSLKVLNLGYNTLSQLSQNQFADLANLEELQLVGNELSALPDELFVRLGHLKHLTLSYNQLVGWPTRAFTGLSELEMLDLSYNELPALPASAFAGHPKLKTLRLRGNPLTSLPLRLFVGLSDLKELNFWNAKLTGLPEGIFAGLSNLTRLDLYGNDIQELPPGLFAGLSRLSYLSIGSNDLTTLPDGIFSGLTNLTELSVYRNQLSSLPAGVFSGLTSLEELSLSRNRVDPLPLSISLEKVGNNQFKAVAPTGAPFALPVPVSSVGGTFEGNAGAVSIPAGAVESSPISVTRVPGAQRRVTVDIGTLPDLPGMHSGYVFEKGEALPISVLPSIDMADATLSDVSLSDGKLDPVFGADTTAYTASVPNAVASITVTPTTSNRNAEAAFQDGSDAALLDADANTAGHQVSLSSGDNAIKVLVTAENGTSVRTYTIVMTRDASICNRTDKVVDAIVQAVSDVDSCGYVSNAHLAEITTLDLSGQGISSLQSGDFRGLSALHILLLSENQLTTLPADIFSGMAALEHLALWRNQLESLPENLFFGLSGLRFLNLSTNRLSSVPDGIFSDLSKLNVIGLGFNRFASLPANTFSGLSLLTSLDLRSNELTNLPADMFSGLSRLQLLSLDFNALTSLTPNVFEGLSSLVNLSLGNAGLTSLPADVFADLSALEGLWLQNNALTSLPAGVFSGLSALQGLSLSSNQLTTLPDGLFAGLSNLRDFRLGGNAVDPLPLSVSLEKAGNKQFKAVAPVGAPFTLAIPVSASSSGAIEGDVEAVTIPAGAVESAPVGVSRVPGANEAVTVDIGTLPGLYVGHLGYFLAKDENLPVEILPADMASDLSLQSVLLNDMEIEPTSDEDTTRYTSTVENAVSSITLTVTPNDPQATLAYFDADDQELADADSVTAGYQADLGVGQNTIKAIVTSQDETATQTYVIVVTRDGAAGVCDRTAQVRDAIMAAVTGVSACAEVTEAHLAGITTLDLRRQSIASLQSGDFAGLSSLEELWLRDNQLTALPADIFSGLAALETLTLWNNQLESLPGNVFAGLSALQVLQLHSNRLSTLPAGLFTGLTRLGTVSLGGNTVDPMPLSFSLAKVGENQFKAVAPTGAPFAMEVPVSSAGGTIDGSAGTVTIPAGAVESVSLGVSRAPGASGAVTVDIGTLPALPGTHTGYVLAKETSSPLTVLPALEPADATLSGLSLSHGTLDPAFDPETTGYTASVPHAVASITVAVTPNNSQATLAYFDADDRELADADSGTEGYQADLDAGDNTVKVKVTSQDETATQTYVIVVTRAGAGIICGRTAQVRDAIVAAVSGVSACAEVTEAHMAGITTLDLNSQSITSLQSGDFSGLPALETLRLHTNQLTALPADVFAGLSALEYLELQNNQLQSVPGNVFSGLSALQNLWLHDNALSSLPSGVFSGLSSLQDLWLHQNALTSLPAGLFTGLSALVDIRLAGNQLTMLPDGLFAGLTSLGTLTLGGNTVDPMPLSVSLAKVGENQFKAVAPIGAPFALVLPVSSAAGTIDGSASSVTIPAGAAESPSVGVSRAPGVIEAVTVDIGTLPALPGAHSGYVLEKGATLPLAVFPPRKSSDTALSGLSLSHGTLDPVFDPDMSRYTASVPHAVASITVNATPRISQATLAYFDADDQELADADADTDGHQVSLSSGDNVIKVAVTSEDETLRRRYTIVMTREDSICDRTDAVVGAIVQAVSGVGSCGHVTSAHLAGITLLDLSGQGITSLQSGDFMGLPALQTLHLNDNQLTELPAGIFSLLDALETLSLADNRLESLPVAVFSRLSALRFLYLNANRLDSLPNGTLYGLSKLEVLRLQNNRIGSFRANAFSGLSSLEELLLSDNELTSLPAGVFSGLSALQTLQLHSNRLSTLPDGLFAGLTNLGTLTLESNTVNPMPLSVSLEKAGNNQFKAVAPTGAVFALELPLSVSSGGEIEGSADSITIPAGAVESMSLSVTRVAGAGSAVTMDIGTLPSLPSAHSGYELEKDTSLPLTVLPSLGSAETRLSDLSLSDGTLDPVFDPDTSRYTASVPHAVASITVTPATSNQNAAAAFHDGSDAALPDADANTDGHQVSLSSGENVIKVVVTAENGTSVRTYTLVMTRQASICTRTAQVVDAIVQAVSGVDSCGYVSTAHLAGITTLDLSGESITSLKSGDFAGLSALQTLRLQNNQLTALPADIFSGLAALETLGLENNQLQSVPGNVFSGLSKLRQLYLYRNRLTGLPAGIFSGLSQLDSLLLSNNRIASLPANVFSGLSSLEAIWLSENELTSLPAGVFAGLSSLQTLYLNNNELTSLRADEFAGLSALQTLWLNSNAFTSLPAGLFSGLSALQRLGLDGNRLTTLPDGLFAGLTNLGTLTLGSNTVNPMPLSVSLTKVGENRFKAVAPTGALFALELSLSVSSGGEIEGSADSITIPAGAVESGSLSVTRTYEAGPAVTVDIGALPQLPTSHYGYVLEKDTSLPLSVLPSRESADTALSGLSLSHGTLDPVFASETTRYTASVPHAVASITVNVTPRISQATLAYFDADDRELADADAGTAGHQANLDVGDNTVKVKVTSQDATATRTYVIVVTRAGAGIICSRTAQVRDAIVAAVTGVSACTEVTETHLAGITTLDLSSQSIASLQSGDFSDLSALETLSLNGNRLTALPDGLFAGLTNLGTLTLGGNTVNPMPLSVSLAKVGENRFKAVAPTGAPFALAVPVSSAGGTIDGGASSITIPAGAVESAAVGVSRAPSAIEAVTVDIGSLPALPGAHTGYVLVKDASLPLSVLPSRESADTALSGLSLSHGTLDPVFDLETTRYTASVPHAAASITVNVTPRNSQATLAYFDADDRELADADAGTEGYQADLDAGDNTVKVKVTSQDETATRTYVIVVTRAGAGVICRRTAQVRDAIMAAASGVSACAEVTEAHLAGITTLDLNSQRITSLQSGDFAGLSALETLRLNFNQLTALPADVFAGLAALEYLELQNNQLQSVPGNVFSGLSALQSLWLHDNILRSLPSGVFSGLSSLEIIQLNGNYLTSLPAGVFSGLSSLQTLWLHQNSLTSLPAGLFTGLSALGELRLADNYLTMLPDGLFAGLTNLGTLTLGSNTVNPMPLSVSLAKVGENQFKAVAPTGAPFALAVAVSSAGGTVDGGATTVTIPAGAVESASVGVSRAEGDTEAVTVDIGTLPALPGAHSGYVLEKDTTLPRVILPATRAAPPAQVAGVEATPGKDQLDVSWTAVSGAGGYKVQWKSGEENYDASRQAVITDGATTSHTIPGLNAGTEYAVRVIATKANANDGPASDEGTGTPRAVTPGQVTGLEVAAGTIRLVVSWTAVAGAGGYKVQWKSGAENYDASRQAVITDGATTNHTITGLTAGTEYTVRVISTKEYADDGSTSDEVTGTPRAVLPGQVTGLEVSPGVELLEVSWTAVSDAGGYKVQWKSGEENYATSRQAVITAGATTSHTITGLTAGTEHTVRVIATKENADDAPASDEVTGTPRAVSPAQVTGLEVAAGTNRLVVSWTAVAAADGYKVQWKSGEEDYATSRQAVITAGATTSHTITGLTAGTEYAVRVIATKEYADDGSPSDGVKGTPLAVAVLNSFSLSDGTLDPAFASDTTSYKASVVNAVSSITVTVTTNFANATVAFVDRNDAALPDADANTDGHQVSLSSGDNVIKVVVTAEDGGSVRTYTLVMTRKDIICNRTDEVVDAIVRVVSGVDSCGEVSNAHLAEITLLDLSGQSISSLQSGDFAGLSALQTLRLHTNQLTALPADVFAGLSALKYLELQNNQLQSVPGNVFSGLSALQNLWLHDNALSSLPSGVFSGLSSLERIRLNGNLLKSLPSGVFSGLSSVDDLRLNGNGLTSLPSGVFSGLSSLQTLRLHQNALTSLPAGVFSGLSALEELQLAGNSLTTLPDGLFAGLTNLGTLTLGSNTVNPMPLSVSLEKVGNNQFKAVAPTGAPFALAVPVSSAGGTIDGSASSVTIPAGAVESASVGVSRAEGDTEAVTVDIGTLPALPSSHTGYALNRDSTLPRVILPATSAAPPAQVTGGVVTRGLGDPDVNGDGALDSNDTLLMWHAFHYESLVGDGEAGGTAESRQRLLAGYSGRIDPSDEDLRAVLRRANAWRTAGVNSGGDINADGMIDGSDARAMYNAYAYESLLGDGEEGGAARFRSRLLGPLAGKPGPSDGNLAEMLRKANRLREEFN